jgi:hypothetical protein
MIIVFKLLLIVGVVLLIWAFLPRKKFFINDLEKEEKEEKKRIKLEDISIIWTKKKKAKIKLEELARIWRNFEITQEQNNIPHFFNPVISEFFEKHIKNKAFYTGNVRVVLNDLLTLLDVEGSVPSVVSGQYETESKIPEDTYKMLSKVTLAEHSIHVAEEILDLVPYGPSLPIALIAALAHDIGKVSKYRKQYYSLGDHAFISMAVLETINGFKDLVYADDILQAVRDHHLKPKTFVGEKLKEADTRARRRELAEVQRKMMMAPTPDAIAFSEPNIEVNVSASTEGFEDKEKKSKEVKKKKELEPQITTFGEVEVFDDSEDNDSRLEVFGVPKDSSKKTELKSDKSDSSNTSNQTTNQTSSNQTSNQTNPNQTSNQTSNQASNQTQPPNQTPFPSSSNQSNQTNLSNSSNKGKWDKEIPKELEVSNLFVNIEFEALKDKEEKKSEKPVEIPLPWFNPDEFLERLFPYVNKLDEKGKWAAISMPNGVVYVQPRLFWDIFFEMAKEKNIMEVFHYEKSEEMKRNCVYSVLKQIQRHKNAIETSLIKKDFFSAPFIVKLKNGKVLSRTLYVPLRAWEAFGVSVGELEARKEEKLLEIEAILPPYEEGKIGSANAF